VAAIDGAQTSDLGDWAGRGVLGQLGRTRHRQRFGGVGVLRTSRRCARGSGIECVLTSESSPRAQRATICRSEFDDNNVPQHIARQLPGGNWTSKLRKGEDIQHDSLNGLEGDLYGKVAIFMMRRPPR